MRDFRTELSAILLHHKVMRLQSYIGDNIKLNVFVCAGWMFAALHWHGHLHVFSHGVHCGA